MPDAARLKSDRSPRPITSGCELKICSVSVVPARETDHADQEIVLATVLGHRRDEFCVENLDRALQVFFQPSRVKPPLQPGPGSIGRHQVREGLTIFPAVVVDGGERVVQAHPLPPGQGLRTKHLNHTLDEVVRKVRAALAVDEVAIALGAIRRELDHALAEGDGLVRAPCVSATARETGQGLKPILRGRPERKRTLEAKRG
jgi:hypothetical protein